MPRIFRLELAERARRCSKCHHPYRLDPLILHLSELVSAFEGRGDRLELELYETTNLIARLSASNERLRRQQIALRERLAEVLQLQPKGCLKR